ncbi:MAG: DUF1611 domain-containing protein [Candidatus Sphingomonas colombiensis]|nr:N-acetyltransferase DgcN [Sphingomonas sp.]WEK44068.1 MAG: DUF1611 domain-containing protein [Sphingomonas sp.]
MQIQTPYLLYLGSATDPLAVKTARGVAHWRPESSVGQMSGADCTVDIGLDELTFDQAVARGAKTFLIGMANAGGFMSPETADAALAAIDAGMNVASGLHERLSSHPAIAEAAARRNVQLFDVRVPPERLKTGTGIPRAGKRLLAVGTDCSVGKMYSTLALEKELLARDVRADFRATGQTGILIAGGGMPIDAVVADFIAGSVEELSPDRNDGGWDLIEGQGSLFHPAYAGVSLGLLHGAQPDALMLCHEVGRTRMRHLPGHAVPTLEDCLARNLEAARLTNPDVIAVGVSLNTSALDAEAALRACAEVEDRLGLPCQDAVAHGLGRVAERLIECFAPSIPA